MKSFQIKSKLLIILFLFVNTSAQTQTIEDKTREEIRRMVIKNIVVGQITLKQSHLNNNKLLIEKRNIGESYILSVIGFGYIKDDLEINIRTVDYKFLKSKWNFFEVLIPWNKKNERIISWYHPRLVSFLLGRKYLIAIDDTGEFKFISSNFSFKHKIAHLFELDFKRPSSYIPFLRLKQYSEQYDLIQYSHLEDARLVFNAEKKVESYLIKRNIVVDPNFPDDLKTKYLKREKIAMPSEDSLDGKEKFKIPLPQSFKDINDKENYLKNALMSNLYLYRILNLPDLTDRLNIDTSNNYFNFGQSDLPELLPNYDEYLGRIELITFDYYYSDNCSEAWKPFQGLITSGKRTIVGNTINENIEFYRFYKDTVETLHRSKRKISNESLLRTHYYYHPDEAKREDERQEAWVKEFGDSILPPPPYPPEPFPEFIGGISDCSPYNIAFAAAWKKRIDYYLLALDPSTREVFFLSGKDIYLTKAMHLYQAGYKTKSKNSKEISLALLLEYIKDRLYAYQVKSVEESHIIAKDENGILLELEGVEYGNIISLKVKFSFNTPDLLEIEKN